MKLYVIIFVLFLIIYIYSVFSMPCNKQIEKMDEMGGKYCENCENKTFGQCMRCFNCGFYSESPGYKGKCIPGTFRGPDNPQLWKDKVKYGLWLHNDNFWRHANKLEVDECIYQPYEIDK